MTCDRGMAARAAVAVLGGLAAGALALAGPAAADVSIAPASATQSEAARLAFKITEDRAGAYTTQLQVQLPAATPIAEVYPLSVDDWAPRTTMRTLPEPIEAIHGTQTSEVVDTLTWIRVTGAPEGGGQGTELQVELGPMPEVDHVSFAVTQTYSDGTVVRWDGTEHPAPVLRLNPAPPAEPTGAADAADAQSSSGGGRFVDGFAVALLLAGVAATLLLGRRAMARFWRAARSGRVELPPVAARPAAAATGAGGPEPAAPEHEPTGEPASGPGGDAPVSPSTVAGGAAR